jgi:hypothetical protein
METTEQFLQDILDHCPAEWKHVLIKRGNSATADEVPPSSRNLRDLAAQHDLSVVEADGYVAISSYDIVSDTTIYRLDRK